MDKSAEFIARMNGSFKTGLFLLLKLPSAFFSGVRIKYITPSECIVTVPNKWFSRNPFKSTYFACLAMAAEMSTGALALAHLYKRKPSVAMLVVKFEAEYFKKAASVTFFTCKEGLTIKDAIDRAIATGEPQVVKIFTEGRDKQGNLIASAHISWSFKARNN